MYVNPDSISNMVTFTTAPIDYDYKGFGNLEVIDHVAESADGRKIWRKILTTTTEFYRDNQRMRYGSGMHPAIDQQEFNKQVESGLIVLTPNQCRKHYQDEVHISQDADDYTQFREIISEYQQMENVTIEPLDLGLTQKIRVTGDLTLFENIVRRLNAAAQVALKTTPTIA